MPPVEFEPTISAGERPKTYALDRAVTETGIQSRCGTQLLYSVLHVFFFGGGGCRPPPSIFKLCNLCVTRVDTVTVSTNARMQQWNRLKIEIVKCDSWQISNCYMFRHRTAVGRESASAKEHTVNRPIDNRIGLFELYSLCKCFRCHSLMMMDDSCNM
jgi:hypothetical protein